MKESGNPSQWGDKYPQKESILEDIKKGNSYLIIDEKSEAHAVFALIKGIDENYLDIDGSWPDELPYATIHRIASDGKIKGVLHEAVRFALKDANRIRIDTHEDNLPMRKALEKEGFTYCGIIGLKDRDNEPRLAYILIR